jgi:hypothetical protein
MAPRGHFPLDPPVLVVCIHDTEISEQHERSVISDRMPRIENTLLRWYGWL